MLARLGFPDITGHRRFVGAVAVDAVGSGVFMPVSVLYFLRTTSLDLPTVGLAMSVASLVCLPFILVVGRIVDAVGAKPILLIANVVQCLGFVAYPWAHSFAPVLALMVLVGLGQSAFWSAYSPMVAQICEPGERELWFGFLGALRNLGFAVGGLLGGVAITIGSDTAFHAVVWLNAVSYAFAFVLLCLVRAGHRVAPATDKGEALVAGRWSVVLRDRPYLLLVAANLAYALCGLALNFAMPVYAVETLGLPGWTTGAIFTINTVMVGFGQGWVVRRMAGHRRWRIAMIGQLVYAGSFVLMAAVGWVPGLFGALAIVLVGAIYTVGELMGGPVLTAVAVDSRPAHLRGRYMGLYQLSWNVASIIAPLVFSWLLVHGRASAWVFLLVVALVGAAVALRLPQVLPVAAARVTNGADELEAEGEAVAAFGG